jgi:hypothetical protein
VHAFTLKGLAMLFLLGLFVGFLFGLIFAGLCNVAGKEDEALPESNIEGAA